ncbi:MAG TPA: Gfo/Idh/MocA family oxidoreductase [Verrucomicrobiae bacterium]|nr:Gfo/Idh/MocA family oxidoreductase [Verrucomicrobiae bacterium]
MPLPLNRRSFLQQSAVLAAAACAPAAFAASKKLSPNEKLNLAFVGVAGRGGENFHEVLKLNQNTIAICDIDSNNLAAAAQKVPGAKTFSYFRRMLDLKDIDAVVVSTPDHTHAVAAVAALKSGRHVYCEKPLARTISEIRAIVETARKEKRVTQIGTQIHAGKNYRRVVELIQSNSIGTVREVHVWASAVYGGMEAPTHFPPVPANIDYEQWLGPVPFQPYSPEYIPFKWRNWWAFGGGSLADFGCHFMDLPHWALDLRAPLSAEVVDGPPVHKYSTPPWLIVRYEHPARGAKPPVRVTWYHGGKYPKDLVSPELYAKWKSGVLFVGEKGMVLSDYSRNLLLPEKDFVDFKRPAPFIPDSIGHHKEWVEACKTGGPTTCTFDYSGPLSETALLGNVAFRVGKKLEWDTKTLKAKGCPEADQYIHHHYRDGWKL